MARILVAEDDGDIADLFTQVLASHGHEVVHARDGREALDRCRSDYFDLLVLDISMPHLTGLEIADELSEEGLLRWAPLVFVTALAAERYAPLGRARGATGFLSKPLRLSKLVDTVHALLESQAGPSGDLGDGPAEPPPAAEVAVAVETYFADGRWRNRYSDGQSVDGAYTTRSAASAEGFALAVRDDLPHRIVYRRRRGASITVGVGRRPATT